MLDPLLKKLEQRLNKLVQHGILTILERNIELSDYQWQKKTFTERMGLKCS